MLFAVPVRKAVEAKAPASRPSYKSYKIQQEPAEMEEAGPRLEESAVEIDEEETPEPASEGIPEIEDEEIDETLPVEIKDRGEQ